MNFAEFFVKMGLSGDSVVVAGLKKVQESFKNVTSSSFEAKAMMAGAIYGLKQVGDFATKTGTDLYKFQNAFGLSSQELQKWQIWLRDFGAAEDVQNAIEGIQQAMANMELKGIVPEAFARLHIETEGRSAFDVLDQIRSKIKTVSPALGMALVEGIGINPNLFQALRVMRKRAIGPDETLNDKQIKNLQKMNAEWERFFWNLKMMGSKIFSEQGSGVIGQLDLMISGFKTATGEVKKIHDNFKTIQDAMPGIRIAVAMAFGPLATVVMAMSELAKFQGEMNEQNEGAETAGRDKASFVGWIREIFSSAYIKNPNGSGYVLKNDQTDVDEYIKLMMPRPKKNMVGGQFQQGQSKETHVLIQSQNINVADPTKIADQVKNALRGMNQ